MPLTSLSAAKVVEGVIVRKIFVIVSNSRLLKTISRYQIFSKKEVKCDLIPSISVFQLFLSLVSLIRLY